jgi:hypothetical protein
VLDRGRGRAARMGFPSRRVTQGGQGTFMRSTQGRPWEAIRVSPRDRLRLRHKMELRPRVLRLDRGTVARLRSGTDALSVQHLGERP